LSSISEKSPVNILNSEELEDLNNLLKF
jgi:hypothetical protein